METSAAGDAMRTELPGHSHVPLHGEEQKGQTDRDAELQVTLLLRRRQALPDPHAEFGSQLPHQKKHLTVAELASAFGATQDDTARVERFAAAHGLTVLEIAHHQRKVVLRGNAANMEKAFGVSLVEMEHRRGNYRATSGTASLPHELRNVVQAVMGLNTRPCARRRAVHHNNTTTPYWTAPQMAEAYGFSSARSAAGQSIALIELGGGYHEEDLRQFFNGLEMTMPVVRCVTVDGAQNAPASVEQIKQFLDVVEGKRKISEVPEEILSAAQCTVEVTMDIELAAALAPGAEIVVYMTPGTEQGIYDAISMAIADPERLPSAISISWGEPETGVSGAYLSSVDEVLREAALLGVTVCASSGDDGAMNGSTDGTPTVNFPASSPHVLSCGGSTVRAATDENLREAAWNCMLHGMHGATGGGVSRNFETPPWQQDHGVPLAPTGNKGRGVPDVAGPADPHRGCAILVGGESCSSAGTSAVAPLWAAMVACMNTALGARCGFITPLLYQLAKSGDGPLHAITEGDNGFYKTGQGWNACTGLGSPEVDKLITALGKGRGGTPSGAR
jgi:kumamolisin